MSVRRIGVLTSGGDAPGAMSVNWLAITVSKLS